MWNPCRTIYRGANGVYVDGIDPDHKEESRRRGNVLQIFDIGYFELGSGPFLWAPCVSCLWRVRSSGH